MDNNFLFFFSALGAFNGLLLSFYFIFFAKSKIQSKIYLGILILALSLRIGKSVLLVFDPDLHKMYLQIGLSGCFFIGPALYLYLKSSLGGKVKEARTLLLSTLIIITLIGIVYPYQNYPDYWNNYIILIIYAQWFAFMILSGFFLKNILFDILRNPSQLSEKKKWRVGLYLSITVIFLSYNLDFIPYISASLIFSLLVYLLMPYYFFSANGKAVIVGLPPKYLNKKIENSEAREIIDGLRMYMENSKPYTSANLKIKDAAKELKISPHILSQVLNDNLNTSFPQFVNEYRIKTAVELISTHDHYTIEAIGSEVGFNSKTSFYASFGKFMGTTPAQYKKNLKNTS